MSTAPIPVGQYSAATVKLMNRCLALLDESRAVMAILRNTIEKSANARTWWLLQHPEHAGMQHRML